MLTGPILAHWDVITAMIRQTSLVRALLEGGRVLVGLLVPETAADGLREVFLMRSRPKPPVGRRDSWLDQEEDESDYDSSSSSGDVITRQIPTPRPGLARVTDIRTTSTITDQGANENPMSPSTKRRKVDEGAQQVLSDSDGLEFEDALPSQYVDTPPSVRGVVRHNYTLPVNPVSNSLSTAMPQQQQQQQQWKQHYLGAASLPEIENVNFPHRAKRRAMLDDGGTQAVACNPGSVGDPQTTAPKVPNGAALSDAAKTPAKIGIAGGQQQGPNGTVQLDAPARLAAIKVRMAERRRLQEERNTAETPGAPAAKPVSLGHPMDLVEPPPKYRNEVWFRPS